MIRLFGDFLLILPLDERSEDDKLFDSDRFEQVEVKAGTVLELGADANTVKSGALVLYTPHKAYKYKEFEVISERDLLGVVHENSMLLGQTEGEELAAVLKLC